MEKVLFAWSSGKDSAMALHVLKQQADCKIVALLTTMTKDYDRVSMHGVQRALVEKQAESLDYPLEIVWIPKGCSNDEYEAT
jgi:diphthamide synthase (EF-2-diphthine--ammonia ligase)